MAITPLPHIALEVPPSMHVGQSRSLPELVITELGIRRGRHFLILPGALMQVEDPGGAVDRASLASGEWSRAAMRDEDRARWSFARDAERTVQASEVPGPFEHVVTLQQGPIRVSRTLPALALSDAPDPLFPVRVGTRLTSALLPPARLRSSGRRPIRISGPTRPEPRFEDALRIPTRPDGPDSLDFPERTTRSSVPSPCSPRRPAAIRPRSSPSRPPDCSPPSGRSRRVLVIRGPTAVP
jgi:hypothetical protein